MTQYRLIRLQASHKLYGKHKTAIRKLLNSAILLIFELSTAKTGKLCKLFRHVLSSERPIVSDLDAKTAYLSVTNQFVGYLPPNLLNSVIQGMSLDLCVIGADKQCS